MDGHFTQNFLSTNSIQNFSVKWRQMQHALTSLDAFPENFAGSCYTSHEQIITEKAAHTMVGKD